MHPPLRKSKTTKIAPRAPSSRTNDNDATSTKTELHPRPKDQPLEDAPPDPPPENPIETSAFGASFVADTCSVKSDVSVFPLASCPRTRSTCLPTCAPVSGEKRNRRFPPSNDIQSGREASVCAEENPSRPNRTLRTGRTLLRRRRALEQNLPGRRRGKNQKMGAVYKTRRRRLLVRKGLETVAPRRILRNLLVLQRARNRRVVHGLHPQHEIRMRTLLRLRVRANPCVFPYDPKRMHPRMRVLFGTECECACLGVERYPRRKKHEHLLSGPVHHVLPVPVLRRPKRMIRHTRRIVLLVCKLGKHIGVGRILHHRVWVCQTAHVVHRSDHHLKFRFIHNPGESVPRTRSLYLPACELSVGVNVNCNFVVSPSTAPNLIQAAGRTKRLSTLF